MEYLNLFNFPEFLMNTSHTIHTFLIKKWSKRYGWCERCASGFSKNKRVSHNPYLFDHRMIKKVWMAWEVLIRNSGKLKRFSKSIPFWRMARPRGHWQECGLRGTHSCSEYIEFNTIWIKINTDLYSPQHTPEAVLWSLQIFPYGFILKSFWF